METLRKLGAFTRDTVKIELGKRFEDRLKRSPLSVLQAKVASAGGFLVYLKQRVRRQFFEEYAKRLWTIPHSWTSHKQHGAILIEFEDVGGFVCCPSGEAREKVLMWVVRCYLGEPGRYGTWGRNREVFYSNDGAARVAGLIKNGGVETKADIERLAEHPEIKAIVQHKAIARRFEVLLDLAEPM